jgi:hypothetical protein
MSDPRREPPREFSITAGGPMYRLGRLVGLVGADHAVRIWRVVAFAWLPLLLAALFRIVIGDRPEPIFFDLSVHTRFLVSLPLLVLSGRLLEAQCRAAVTLLYVGKLADRGALDRVIDRAEKLRDTPWVEAVLAAMALLGGQLVLWGVAGPTGVFHGIEHANLSASQVWYAGIALPLLQFLALRWLWRWVIWTYVLVRMSRLPLAAIATHPDRAAGLRFFSAPLTGFAVFVMAFASLLASVWGTQLADERVTVPAILPTLIAFLVIAFLVGCVPLVVFSPHLYRAQRKALLVYGPFALDYVERFHAKWIERRPNEELLGTPDLQSMADLGNSYQVIRETGTFVFSMRNLSELWLAGILPMLPLVATVVPLDQMVKRIGSMLFGGLL